MRDVEGNKEKRRAAVARNDAFAVCLPTCANIRTSSWRLESSQGVLVGVRGFGQWRDMGIVV